MQLLKKTEKECIFTNPTFLSAPRGKVKLFPGKKRSSIDHRGIDRTYIASCSKGVLINKYFTDRGIAETKIWLDKNDNLNILYDFAKDKILLCNRTSSVSSN